MLINKKFLFFTLFTLAFAAYMLIRLRVSNDIYDIALCSTITASAFFVVSILLSYKNKLVHALAIFVASLISLSYGTLSYINAYYIKNDTHLSEPDVFAVLQTNTSEAFFFFWENIFTLPGLLVLFTLPMAIFYIFSKTSNFFAHTVPVLAKNVILVSCCILIMLSYDKLHLYKFIDSRIFSYIEALNNFKVHSNSPMSSEKIHGSLAGENEVYVMIIGESQTRDYMQVFSPYPSITNTPWLLSKRSHLDWVFFDNSYSFHTHTVPSLSAALTNQRTLSPKQKKHTETILSLSKRYGMKTVWISNQSRHGLYENAITALASTADVVRFTEDNEKTKHLDLEVVPILVEELKKLKPKQNALFVIHLMGSHSPYRLRYPDNFPEFKLNNSQFLGKFATNKNRDEFMEYLTSTQYTDFVLQNIFLELSHIDKATLLMYFSDHGEDPVETLGHHFTAFQWSMSRIPFAVWVSKKYSKQYPHKLPALVANKNKIFTNDLIFDAYSGFLNIKDIVYDEKFDIGSNKYNITLNNASISNDIPIKNDYSFRISEHDNLMALDSNSIFKVAQAHSKNVTSFQVTTEFIKDDTGKMALFVMDEDNNPIISLDAYINLTQNFIKTLYVDINNLNLNNMSSISDLLEKYNKKYNIKERLFIGCTNLSHFSDLLDDKWRLVYTVLNIQDLTDKQCILISKYKFYGINFQLQNFARIEKDFGKYLTDIKYFAWNKEWHFSDKNLANALTPYSKIERIAIIFNSAFSH